MKFDKKAENAMRLLSQWSMIGLCAFMLITMVLLSAFAIFAIYKYMFFNI